MLTIKKWQEIKEHTHWRSGVIGLCLLWWFSEYFSSSPPLLPGVLYLLLRSLVPAEIDRKAGELAAAAAGGDTNSVQHDFKSSNALYGCASHPILLALFAGPELWFLLQMSSLVPDMSRYMKYYCTASVFMKTLMLKGYAFNNSTFPQISFQKKVNETRSDESALYLT